MCILGIAYKPGSLIWTSFLIFACSVNWLHGLVVAKKIPNLRTRVQILVLLFFPNIKGILGISYNLGKIHLGCCLKLCWL